MKKTYISWFHIQKFNNKRPFILFNLRFFLASKIYWYLKNTIILKNYKNIVIQKQNYKIFQQSHPTLYTAFYQTFYSVTKFSCWDNFTNGLQFAYYNTVLPFKQDFLIFHYKKSIECQSAAQKMVPFLGAQIFNILLNELSHTSRLINLWALEKQLRVQLFEIAELASTNEMIQKIKLLRRLKLVWYFRRTNNEPNWLILSNLPVLPPDLRPIIQLEGNQIAISDLNKLYQKVLFRNRRMQKLKASQYVNTSEEVQYAQRLLQESVDSLIENGKSDSSVNSGLTDRPLKSLSDILKGKRGRFRQNLLGKRVDYSGRSVIVVGPQLKVHECGIPVEMAIELFQPFLIRHLIFHKKTRTILGAKQLIQKGGSFIQEILYQIVPSYPVLLNRAPTLHRLSIQSFQPRLVEGRAIILHPLVCTAFNADFDGDQMAVHVPLSYKARSESWKLLWSQNNLLSPATGQPILIPTQDMVLGWYYLTAFDLKKFYTHLLRNIKKELHISTINKIFNLQKVPRFHTLKIFKKNDDVFTAYNQNIINIHTPFWLMWKGWFELEKSNQPILEIRLKPNGNLLLFSYQFQIQFNWYGLKISQFICTTIGKVLLNSFLQ